MKTKADIVAYLEMELAEAHEIYDEVKGKDAYQANACLVKIITIEQILDALKQN